MKSGVKKNRNIFEKLSDKTRSDLLVMGKVSEYEKEEIIFLEREKIKHIFIVMDGYVSLYRNSRYGDEKNIFICAKGEILNEVMLQDEYSSAAAKALSRIKLLKIRVKDMREFAYNNTEIYKELYDSMALKLRRLYHQVGNANGTYPLGKHLAAKIWKLARDYGVNTEDGRRVDFDISVTFLGYMCGAKRESVSRELSKMRKDKLVTYEKGILTVPDMDKLKKLYRLCKNKLS